MSDEQELDRRLDEAAGAYAAHTSGTGDRSADTRARVLASVRAKRARSERATMWLAAAIVIVALLGVPTVWAYWTGRLGGTTRPEETPAPTIATPPPSPPAPRVSAVVVPQAEVEVPPVALAPGPAPSVSSVIESASADVPAPAPEPESIVDPAERLAYRRAHTLHFETHDPAGALGAWDAYLASYPHGRFTLEARYNRALCLVRLDRRGEAEQALAPFAAGTHGGYRREEASALIEALESE